VLPAKESVGQRLNSPDPPAGCGQVRRDWHRDEPVEQVVFELDDRVLDWWLPERRSQVEPAAGERLRRRILHQHAGRVRVAAPLPAGVRRIPSPEPYAGATSIQRMPAGQAASSTSSNRSAGTCE
jgi:hypothetical protein